jgi:hypothetical protein
MVYVIQVCRQLSSRTRIELQFHPGPAVWHIPLLSVQWIQSWWWTDELSEKYRVSWQNTFLKLVHLFGFITKKFNVPCWCTVSNGSLCRIWEYTQPIILLLMKTFIYKTQYSVPFYIRRRVTLGTCSECLVRNVNLLLKNDGEIQMALRSWRCGRAAWQVVKNMAYMWTLGRLSWKKKHASSWYTHTKNSGSCQAALNFVC